MASSVLKLRAEFKSLFFLFIRPVSRKWASDVGRWYWRIECGLWVDQIAGPLSTIADSGGCAYVYPRDDKYFKNVNDPASLRLRILEWHTVIIEKVDRFIPATEDEAMDSKLMQSLVEDLKSLIEMACAVEQARWLSAKKT